MGTTTPGLKRGTEGSEVEPNTRIETTASQPSMIRETECPA
ncbi:hypothetical protein [Arthrospira platensis]